MRLRAALFLLFFVLISGLSLFLTPNTQAGECTNKGLLCSCDSSGASCSGPWVVSFDCDGRVSDCRNNEGNHSSTSGLSCGKSRQIDVFDHNCREGGPDTWSCPGTENMLGHAVWYAGDCPGGGGNDPPPEDQCKDALPRFRFTGDTKWLGPKQMRESGPIYQNDLIDFACVDAKGKGINFNIAKSVVLPDKSIRKLPPQNKVVSQTTLDQLGEYTFRCRTTKTNYWCPSNGVLNVTEQPVTVCGGNCSERGNLCPEGNICNETTGTCQLTSCYANPDLCKTNMCEPLPQVECGSECGVDTGLCNEGNTCDEGRCVINECLSSGVNCATDRCSVLPTVQCGEPCGPDTAVCPAYQSCSSETGLCARDTCLDNPSRCEADMCEVIPLTMQCLNIEPNFDKFELGGSYAFTCSEVPNAQRYEFSAMYTTQKEGRDNVEVTQISPASAGSNISETFDVTKIGRYIFQCRPCMENDVCTEWGDSSVIVVSSPEPTPPTTPTPVASPTPSPTPTPDLSDLDNDKDDEDNTGYVSSDCKVGGCSGTLCLNKDAENLATTCDFKPEYACYGQVGRCEIQADTQTCGWTQTEALTQCINNAESGKNLSL